MIAIDEAFVSAAAPNADAEKNGRGLVAKGKYVLLRHDADQTLLFGECQGSGKEPYRCSCDFARAEQPTYRCSCPSRQFPCKHCIGLMFAWVKKPTAFSAADVPEDLAAKREKLIAKEEKKRSEPEKPKQVNKSALAKKVKAQLEGIDLLERLTLDLMKLGIGNTNAKTAREIEEKAKQLGNSYIPGAQTALYRYTRLFADENGAFHVEASERVREAAFGEALDQLTRLHALVKQGRAYLEKRLEDPELKPDTTSAIAAWLGHAWQLSEFRAEGLVESGVELMQLAFNTYDDRARGEYIDTGMWMNLASGKIGLTQNFRPYKAAKYIKSDDSFFQIAQVPELCVYPGDVNPRIRWDGFSARPATNGDRRRAAAHARGEFAAVVKEVKNLLKSPLAERRPIYALRFEKLGIVDGVPTIEDAQGERLAMTDRGFDDEPPSCHMIRFLPSEMLRKTTLIARFLHDVDTRKLRIKPLAVLNETRHVRLTF